MSADFEDKIALVTGASTGIGAATALGLAKYGAQVVIGDIDEEGASQTVEMIQSIGAEVHFFKADVSQEEQVKALIEEAAALAGRLDIAVNNAGISGSSGATADSSIQNWNKVIAINLTGVFLCMKYEIQQMLQQGFGAIVNMSSAVGLVGWPGNPAYVASKHGVTGLTKAAAVEYASKGIRINAVCPAVIRTPLMEKAIGGDPEAEAARIANLPIGRMGTPEEVASAVLWLCSDETGYVIGHNLSVDGGFVVR